MAIAAIVPNQFFESFRFIKHSLCANKLCRQSVIRDKSRAHGRETIAGFSPYQTREDQMLKLNKERILMTVAAAIVCAPAIAVDYSCSGPVTGVTVSPGGIVSAANAGGQSWGYFCQLGTTINGVSPEACKGILSVLLTAQASGKSIVIWYRDNLSCSTYRGWNWLDTVYWGPMLGD